MKKRIGAIAILVVLGAICTSARGWINPAFTPLDLVSGADAVLLLEFKSVGDKGDAVATVKRVLKGDFADKEVKMKLLAGAIEEQGRKVIEVINEGQKEGLLFIGTFPDPGQGDVGGGGMPEEKGFLHLGSLSFSQIQWVELRRYEDTWDMDKLSQPMLGTFAGGTDMLLQCVEYILNDPDPTVPCDEGVDWDKEIEVAKVTGAYSLAQAVDLRGNGKVDLFIAGEGGDKLFRWNGKGFDDVTAKHALASKSLAAAWGDFNADGKLDLAAWDGKQLTIYSQQTDGTLKGAPCSVGDALKDGCLSLTTLDTGNKGRPGLLAATKASPVLITIEADGSGKAKALVSGEFPGKELSDASHCFVADFDGDRKPDVMQMFARGGLFYKGKAPGEFEPPAMTRILAGKGRTGACLGDYDHNGLLDILVVGEERYHLWHNYGQNRFFDGFDLAGEIGYHPKPGAIYCQTTEVNNDGRQDVLIAYSNMAPQLYFNRGFRSFGQAMKLDLADKKILPQSQQGQYAACAGDFNGDGAMDMALVLVNGEVWLLPRRIDDQALAAQAAFSLAAPCAGPVNVMGWNDKRSLGAWPIRPGDPGAFFGTQVPGTVITVKWRMPEGEQQSRDVVVKDGVSTTVLDKK